MTYIVPEIALATRGDIVGILDLQEQNLLGQGGLLSAEKAAINLECSNQANARGLHGSERQAFRAGCKRNRGAPQ
jgi:hypothetical protein